MAPLLDHASRHAYEVGIFRIAIVALVVLAAVILASIAFDWTLRVRALVRADDRSGRRPAVLNLRVEWLRG